MKVAMIAFDLDDTLLDDEWRISPKNKEAIKKIKASGIEVVLATGRMFQAAIHFHRELELKTPLISYQGAFVKDPEGKVLYHRPLEAADAKRIISDGKKYGFDINFYLNDVLYVEKISPWVNYYVQLAGDIDYRQVDDFSQLLDHDPTKILMMGKQEELGEYEKKMKKRFGKKIYITSSKANFLEFMDGQANKGAALTKVATEMGIKREEIIAFGDGMNDLALFEAAGYRVAMANGNPLLQKKADMVARSNREDGVYYALKELNLI